MTPTNLSILATAATAIISAALTSTGIAAYFQYRASREKVSAEAKDISVTAEIKVSDKWQEYAERMEAKNTALEARYDALLKMKDEKIALLESKIDVLETELESYRGIRVRTERARTDLKKTVDDKMDDIKRNGSFNGNGI